MVKVKKKDRDKDRDSDDQLSEEPKVQFGETMMGFAAATPGENT